MDYNTLWWRLKFRVAGENGAYPVVEEHDVFEENRKAAVRYCYENLYSDVQAALVACYGMGRYGDWLVLHPAECDSQEWEKLYAQSLQKDSRHAPFW